MKSVKGKIVLITGGAMGMGKDLARKFAKDGARLVLWDLRQADLDKTAEELKGLGAEVHTYVCDVTKREMVYDIASKVKKDVGIVDILDNNAGIVYGGNFLDVPDEKHFKCIDVNVNGILWCTKAFLPDMVKRNDGHLINMASAAGLIGVGGLAVYCATKHAVVGFSDALRVELKRMKISGVKITIVCPSFVQTGMFDGVKPPMFTPWLSTEVMSQKIYSGCLNEKYFVREPLMVKFIPFLKGITTTRVMDFTGTILGMNSAADSWHGRADQDKFLNK
jgi:all-trans-retinol dehydrogenase (NAD+)